MVFFDDVLVYSASMIEHMQHLLIVLQNLLESQSFAKLGKCQFCQDSIEYLGHIISAAGVQSDPHKVQVMTNSSIPKTLK